MYNLKDLKKIKKLANEILKTDNGFYGKALFESNFLEYLNQDIDALKKEAKIEKIEKKLQDKIKKLQLKLISEIYLITN